MADPRWFPRPRRVALALSAIVLLGSPASGQGPFPPVPGPFPVRQGVEFAMQAPALQAPAAEAGEAQTRPLFQPPVNAMRIPYWMQTPQSAGSESAPEQTTRPEASRAATTARQPTAPQGMGATGYVQPRPSWTVPLPGAQGYGVQGFGGQAPWMGQPAAGATTGYAAPGAPGTGQGVQPGWGYGVAPGWGQVPYAPAPGWGWAAPTTRAGQ